MRGFEAEIGALRKEVERLRNQIEELERENSELRRQLEKERRQNKRQASPFSKGDPKPEPKKPGRKPGNSYGKHSRRRIPPKIDRRESVPCPLWCKHCGGKVKLDHKESQYQTDIPPIRPETIEFEMQVGRCVRCGRHVRGRHPEQVSKSAGEVGGVQLGARAIALAVHLNKNCGMSWERIAKLYDQVFDLKVSRSGLCRMMQRMAQKAEPIYECLIGQVRGSPIVSPDETGWRIGGRKAWLHVAVAVQATVYKVSRGRGYPEASALLGENYGGTIVADGWPPYRRFKNATRQSCLAHLLRRCNELERTPGNPEAKPWLASVKQVLQGSLVLRDRREQMTPHGFAVARGRLEAELSRLLDDPPLDDASLRFALHLWREWDALFVFLRDPKVDATNFRSEQAIRPAVVNRKMSGGNRTENGAHAQEVLLSILRTSDQRQLTLLDPLISLLRTSPHQLHTLTW